MARAVVLEASEVFEVLAGSTAVTIGDAVYDDGTDWELADANDSTKYAQAFAVSDAPSAGVLKVARKVVVFDSDDNSFSSNTKDVLYLSGTAGAVTTTRPTGANDLAQVVGHAYKRHGGTGAQVAVLEARGPYEVTVNVPMHANTATAAVDTDGDFGGYVLAANNDAVHGTFEVPSNCVGLVTATFWWCGTGTELDASDTYTIDVSAGIDDETTSATTDGIAAAALTVAANDLANADVSAAFDGAGIIEPRNIVGVDVAKAAEGTAGDDPIVLTVSVVLEVV